MPIMPPGMFLSQPPITSTPSIHWPPTQVSIAVGDDLARHQRVLHALGAHRHAVGDGRRAEDLRRCAPASLMPATAASASCCRPELHGVIVEWPLATPIIGLSKSPSS